MSTATNVTPTFQATGLVEQDIDFLLMEEFFCNQKFQAWFLSKVKLTKAGTLTQVTRSASGGNGETDIQVDFCNAQSQRTCLLIENKLAAQFQKEQGPRYAIRRDNIMKQGDVVCKAVLVAPKIYLGKKKKLAGFNEFVSYEDLQEWFQAQRAMGTRACYKAALIGKALLRQKQGWLPEEDKHVTQFWRDYYELAIRYASDLHMVPPKTGGRPSGSSFVPFKPKLPANVELLHKMAYGHVDIQLNGMGNKIAELKRLFDEHREPDMQIEKASKSAVIRINVPIVNFMGRFEPEETNVRICLDATRRLYTWFQKHNHLLALVDDNRL